MSVMIEILLAALAQDAFEPKARERIGDVPGLTLEADQRLRYERFARAGHERLFARDPRSWFPYVLQGLISDHPPIAAASLRVLRELCARHRVTDDNGDNPARLDRLNSAGYRAELYKTCVAWYLQNKDQLAKDRPAVIRWNDLMRDLRAGGCLDDPARPEGRAFLAFKGHGLLAWPVLASFVGDDDLATSRTAVKVLNRLTGRDTPLPTEATREAQRHEWRAWLIEQGHVLPPEQPDLLPLLADTSSDEDLDALLRRLETGDIQVRDAAARELRGRLFRHEARLRRVLDTSDQPEVRVRLGPLLDEVPALKQIALDLRGDPVWLRTAIVRLRRETPDLAAFGRRVERLMVSIQDLWTEMRDIDHRRDLILKARDLDVPGRARWGDALTDWEAFEADVEPAADLHAVIQAERRKINDAAGKDVEYTRREALRIFRSAGPADANAYLEGQRVRFEGTEGYGEVLNIQKVLLAP
jgi:hypothetical protein